MKWIPARGIPRPQTPEEPFFKDSTLEPKFLPSCPKGSPNPQPDHLRDTPTPRARLGRQPLGLPFLSPWVRPLRLTGPQSGPLLSPRPGGVPAPHQYRGRRSLILRLPGARCESVRLRAPGRQLPQPLPPPPAGDWLRAAPGTAPRQVPAPKAAAAIFVTGACPWGPRRKRRCWQEESRWPGFLTVHPPFTSIVA